jgi:hypothetical protein
MIAYRGNKMEAEWDFSLETPIGGDHRLPFAPNPA